MRIKGNAQHTLSPPPDDSSAFRAVETTFKVTRKDEFELNYLIEHGTEKGIEEGFISTEIAKMFSRQWIVNVGAIIISKKPATVHVWMLE